MRNPKKQSASTRYRIAELLSMKEYIMGLTIERIAGELSKRYDDVKFALCDEYNDVYDSNVAYSETSKVWYLIANVDHIRFNLGSFAQKKNSRYNNYTVEFIKWGLDTGSLLVDEVASLVVEGLFHVATNKDASWSPPEDVRQQWIDKMKTSNVGKYEEIISHLTKKQEFTQDVLVSLSKTLGGGLNLSPVLDGEKPNYTMGEVDFSISGVCLKKLTDACDATVIVA